MSTLLFTIIFVISDLSYDDAVISGKRDEASEWEPEYESEYVSESESESPLGERL